MADVIHCTGASGTGYQYIDKVIGSGKMKDVYFSPNKDYAVAFYKDPPSAPALERINMITTRYHEQIFNQIGGKYWNDLFCWPYDVVEHGGRTGIVMPVYDGKFFFSHGSVNNDMMNIKGQEKEGKWFASAKLRNRFIEPKELGDWSTHLRSSLLIARAVRRMHMAGLAHSDLSYKNVLVDPSTGGACIIDIDGLVVPGKYPPDVVGTPDFIAPEVVATSHLDPADSNRCLPRVETDLHALAVLIYMYLLYRHPLKGKKVHCVDDDLMDERLSMGEKALFVEHPTDTSNRIRTDDKHASELPWADTGKMPYTLTGPYLSELFEKAFVHSLHSPADRPTANEWETALVKTVDLIQPCLNTDCDQKWYVFDNKTKPVCPFCGTPFKGVLPVLNLYSARQPNNFKPDNHRLMVWSGQSFFSWHANTSVIPNEKLTDEDARRIGYFQFHNGQWYLVNERLPEIRDVKSGNIVRPGEHIVLVEGQQLLLDANRGGRLISVQLVTC